jgi:hypothetical protein
MYLSESVEQYMDGRTLRHFLDQTDDDIDRATQRKERQSRIIAQINEAGQDSAEASQLLAQFEMTLGSLRAERQMLRHLIKSLKNSGPIKGSA